MSEPRILKAVQSLVGKKLKVRWKVPASPGQQPRVFEYLLPTSELEARTKACREALGSLQLVADAPSDSSLSEALQQLARSGRELYELLMSDPVGATPDGESFRHWFEHNVAASDPGTWRVQFLYQGAQPAIPWGLLYSSSSTVGAGIAYTDYVDFWAHRYSTASYIQSADSPVDDMKMDGNAVLCSLLIEVTDDVDVEMAAHDGESLRMRLWGPLRDHTIRTVRDLTDRFRGKGKGRLHHIVYLNLRTSAGDYTFPDGSLTPDRLAQIAAYLEGGGHAIAMIDREAIIRGDRGREWLETFFNAQWAGLIAAETDITSKRLQHHGFRFLTELLGCGKRLSESLPEIRKQLWPYSLLYGVYSNPDNVFVAPPPQIVKEMRAVLELREQGRFP
jgi:hypothetical protein